jgi:hypothetical protein
MDTQKIDKGLQVSGMYDPMSKLKIKAPNQNIRPIILGEMVQNNQKTVYFLVFFLSFGAIWAPLNRPKKVDKGP